MPLNPPLPAKFTSREELIQHVRRTAFAEGYAVSIKRSTAGVKVHLCCDRGGSYRKRNNLSEETRKRVRTSRLIGCPFLVYGKRGSDGLWALVVQNSQHNHPPSEDMSIHPSYRRLDPDKLEKVKEMSEAGMPPRQILSRLRQIDPNFLVLSRTIYNARQRLRKKEDVKAEQDCERLQAALLVLNNQYPHWSSSKRKRVLHHILELIKERPVNSIGLTLNSPTTADFTDEDQSTGADSSPSSSTTTPSSSTSSAKHRLNHHLHQPQSCHHHLLLQHQHQHQYMVVNENAGECLPETTVITEADHPNAEQVLYLTPVVVSTTAVDATTEGVQETEQLEESCGKERQVMNSMILQSLQLAAAVAVATGNEDPPAPFTSNEPPLSTAQSLMFMASGHPPNGLAESEEGKKLNSTRTCSVCHKNGHNKRTCKDKD